MLWSLKEKVRVLNVIQESTVYQINVILVWLEYSCQTSIHSEAKNDLPSIQLIFIPMAILGVFVTSLFKPLEIGPDRHVVCA